MRSEDRTVRDITRGLMRELGLTTVFGNPGTTEVPFLTGWPDDFRYVLGLQESAVVAMADGYAQSRREPVLVNLHSAGGVGHAQGAIFTAYRNRTPMIVTAGQQTRSLMFDEPFLGATDATTFPKPYVKWSYEPARAADVPAALMRAYQLATTPPYGPVFVSIPADDWDQPGVPVTARPRTPGFAPAPTAVTELADALRRCERPAFVVGPAVDADGAVADMVELAEKTQAAVFAAPMSPRCSFPEDHPQFAGFLQPERRLLSAELAEHDLVVVWGAPAFTFHVYRGESETELPDLFLVHDDPDVLARARQGRGVLGTLAHSLRQVNGRVEASQRSAPETYARPPKPIASTPLTAAYVFDTIAEALPEDAAVVEETPSHRNDLHEYFPIRSTDGGFFTCFSGALGYGIGAAVGVAMADPSRRTVALIGDGSSMYGIQSVWTAVREQAPVTFVIMDNARYAAVAVLGAAAGGSKLPGVELGGIDFAALATSLGCPAKLIRTPKDLNAALAEEFTGKPGPTLLHVKVNPAHRHLY
ncbi:benzoylformate decarboxylase [Saccharopolyspora phatthalungensis]|uniref:Benzoylformate decarboxylase n=1 Tax=Saccharopolyspora phatthalungensis TaxID=664693 RepID=A0A840QAH9_9PSEU|nr:benzoylformate decarboxylase [Saccharopolyspora phatthalungensis]MBB5153843.1 benzoylformate decarboxylase [Saccharopolyspora phatthalungensis]